MSIREQIEELNARYMRAIDDDRLEEWPDFFADDCLYRVTSATNHRDGLEASIVFANSKGMLRDRVSALRQANISHQPLHRSLRAIAAGARQRRPFACHLRSVKGHQRPFTVHRGPIACQQRRSICHPRPVACHHRRIR